MSQTATLGTPVYFYDQSPLSLGWQLAYVNNSNPDEESTTTTLPQTLSGATGQILSVTIVYKGGAIGTSGYLFDTKANADAFLVGHPSLSVGYLDLSTLCPHA